jgi:hypothetical protein
VFEFVQEPVEASEPYKSAQLHVHNQVAGKVSLCQNGSTYFLSVSFCKQKTNIEIKETIDV